MDACISHLYFLKNHFYLVESCNGTIACVSERSLLHLLTFCLQVLVLRELAVSAPTFFFQQVQPFFDNIFYAVWDPKQAIREGAVSALRACLILTTQRETKEMQKPQWYKVINRPTLGPFTAL